MTAQPNKNSIKKLISIAGIASASALLSLPAFALTNSDVTSSNQISNNYSYQSDSTGQLLAQTPSRTQENQPSSTDENNRTNERSTNERSTNESSRSNKDLYRPADSNGSGMRALTGGDSVKGINWPCLNNPNPHCGR